MAEIIVSGSDAAYFPVLRQLLQSIVAVTTRPLAFGVYDFGLTAEQRAALAGGAVIPASVALVSPGWDIPLPQLRDPPAYKKYATIAPFTPRYFPGHATYVWIDADCWLQTSEALDLLIAGAATGRMAVCLSADRNYPAPLPGGKLRRLPDWLGGLRWRTSTYLGNTTRRLYGRGVGNDLFFGHLLNAGVYALRGDAPHWALWEASLRAAHFPTAGYLSDQVPLNHAFHTGNFPVELLPAWCNWMCNRALPALDAATGLFVEPSLPHHPVSLLHMINGSFRGTHAVPIVGGGRRVAVPLTFDGRAERAAALSTSGS